MKRLTSIALVMLCIIASSPVFAQQNTNSKPTLFSAFPDLINCSEAELSRAFTIAANQPATLALASNFSFGGTITSNEVKYSNLQSLILRSPVFSNAIFHLSKRINPDNSITYVGRIINLDYADGYELKQDANRQYQLVKMETARVIQDCGIH